MKIGEDFGRRLRASESASVQKVTIYLANKNSRDEIIDLRPWIERVVGLLTDINEGCTRLPIARGTWREDNDTQHDRTVIIYSYIRNSEIFFERFNEFVLLVHDYGRETEQKSVMVEFSAPDNGEYISNAYFVNRANYLPT